MASAPPSSKDPRPVLVWDGECGFCRRCVLFLQSRVGEGLDCVPYQELGDRYPDLDRSACEKAIHLISANGQIARGAEAAFRALALAPGWGWGLFLYRHLPLFAPASEACYSRVAENRPLVSRVMRLAGGPEPEASTWVWSRRIFLSLLGIVYLIAFSSFWMQADLLVGSQGIFPLADTFALAADVSWLRFPTLFWISHSDEALHTVCVLGCAVAVLLTLGFAPRMALAVLWLAYLSLTQVGDVFMQYQWDALLLETGFLAIFLAPSGLVPGKRWQLAPSTLARLLLLWLLFRLLFRSGMVKLWYADSVWWDLTALQYHYWTQPLPAWSSYYVDSLPDWLHTISAIGMFAIELVLPFLIFGPRRLRKIACLGSVFLQLAIMVTGNYGFFNLNTIALCVLLLDDQTLARILPRSWRCFVDFGAAVPGWQRWVMPPFAAVMLFLSLLMTFRPASVPQGQAPGLLARAYDSILPFRTVNRYGLFAIMTTTRPELVIQGSEDGVSWHTYEFHWKPGRVDRPPAFMQPHMPRVDWQMWFSALTAEKLAPVGYPLTSPEVPEGYRDQQRWLFELLERILLGTPEALRLFSNNPFADKPPQYLHVGMDYYRFADMEDHLETGVWWTRLQSFLFIPTVELIDGRLQLAR